MKKLYQAIEKAVEVIGGSDVSIVLERPQPQFGDYTTNIAMKLAKKLSKNPREIAASIAEQLRSANHEWLKSVEVAAPGFINITLTDEALYSQISPNVPQIFKDKKIVFEYSDPNAFKALHAGHLYTTLVGNSISTLIEAAGAKTIRLNYGGDVGLHAARAMWGIIKRLGGENPEALNNIAEKDRAVWVSQCYVDGTTACESNELYRRQIEVYNKQIYQIHENDDHETAFARIYWECRQWSYDGFKKLYEELGVHAFDEYIPESKVTPIGIETVKQGISKNVFVMSNGAVVYPGEQYGLHTRVFLTSQGLPTYEAKELGLALYKWRNYRFDKSIVITADDIVEYMKVLFSAMTHFFPEIEKRTAHLTHGVIKLSGGRKMSSRKGDVLMANDIIESAVVANIESSGKDNKAVAVGAIKYAFLKQRIGGDIIYDPAESISLSGNSGPYLQYALVRARSILAKSVTDEGSFSTDFEPSERKLVQKLAAFQDECAQAIKEYAPHILCTYLYELAVEFNIFYEHNRVLANERSALRLKLVADYAAILDKGLELLGIERLERM